MKNTRKGLTVILPTYNERRNVLPLITRILNLNHPYELEIIIVDDDSKDGTASAIREIAKNDSRVRLISRLGRSGLASAMKEGLLNAREDIAGIMDADGQHQPEDLIKAVNKLNALGLDIVSGSRFLEGSQIKGLSNRRVEGSSIANQCARFSLNKKYSHLTDFMSGCLVINLQSCLPSIRKVDVNGFKFFYELLAISQGKLKVQEVSIKFQPRSHGNSKLDLAIFWDFLISLIHTISFRMLPRRAISFGIVGSTGVLVQLTTTHILMYMADLNFETALPFSVIIAATSNYLINNILTFRSHRLNGLGLLKGLIKFLIVASLPVLANVGITTIFYNLIADNAIWAQIAGILVVFVWNYTASSKFVWNTP